MKRAMIALLALFWAIPVGAAEPLEVHVFAGQQLLAGGGVVEHALTAWRDKSGWRLVPHPVDSYDQFRKSLRSLPPEDGHRLVLAMLTSRLLDAASSEQFLAISGATQPFEAIDETLKGRDRLRRDRIAWLPVGWVLWSNFPAVRPAGACAPGFAWTTCAEQIGPDSFAINQRAGDPGWPLYGAAVLRAGGKPDAAGPDADAFMDWLATPAAGEVLRRDFVIVAHPDIRARRSVVFKLYDVSATTAPLATSYDSPNPLPRPEIDPLSGTFNACGRNNACPNYLPPPGTEAAMRARVTQLLDGP